jgi:two-component system sensor histidine kinase KdpD
MFEPGWFRSQLGYAVAVAGVALATLLIAVVEQIEEISNISMLYLLPVLATAVVYGRGPAIAAAVAAFFTYDFFFIDPGYTLTVSDPAEWVALVLLLVTGVVAAQLAELLRQQAREARIREREAVVLFDIVRRLGRSEVGEAARDVAERLRSELGVAAVVIELERQGPVGVRAAAGDDAAIAAAAQRSTPDHLLSAGQELPGSGGRWVRIVPGYRRAGAARGALRRVPIEHDGQRLGAITLVAGEDDELFSPAADRLLSAVAAQIAQTAERESFRRAATEAEILRRTDELKTALLNAVSHDLRTPLASIIASAGSLRQVDVSWSDQDRREFAEAIEEEARRLNRIVGNLLDLSRIEAGTLRPEKGWYDFGALVDDVLGRLRGAAEGHELSSEVPGDLPPVPLDYVQIDEVLSNLIENAIKYTPPGTNVVVGARVDGADLVVTVDDDGPGIPEDSLERLFERFQRAEGNGGRPAGTGLGLSVAKGLVEAHGGRISAQNRRGGGASFVFTLPLGVPESGAIAAATPA